MGTSAALRDSGRMDKGTGGPRTVSPSRATTLLVGVAAAVVVVAGLRSAAGIVGPLMLALALTMVFHPLRARLERRMPAWVASVVLLVCVYVLILALTLSLVVSLGRLASLVSTYSADADDLVSHVSEWLRSTGMDDEQVEAVAGSLDSSRLVDLTTSVLSGTLSILSDLLFLVTLLLFLAFDSAHVARLSEGARRHRPHLVEAMGELRPGHPYLPRRLRRLRSDRRGDRHGRAVGDGGARGVRVGVLAFVTNFIPNIGFLIGLVPPAFIGLLEGGLPLALGVVLVYCVINVVIQSIIQPRYVGSAVGLSTTLTFVSLVFWTWVLGPLGALLAVPMSLFFRAVLVEADPAARWLEPLISGHPAERRPGSDPG